MTSAIRLALAGTATLAAALVAWSAGGDPPELEERRARIAAMSDAERRQLKRKFDDFRRMSAEERDAVRKIHDAAQEESFRETLRDYEEFVSRLDPWEQTELRQLSTDKKISRLEALIADRRRGPERGPTAFLSARFMEGTIIEAPELEEAMTLVAQDTGMPAEDLERFRDAPPHVKHLEIARYAAQNARGPGSRGDRGRRELRWPDETTAVAILHYLPDGGFKRFLLDEKHSPEGRTWAAMSVLMRSVFAEWQAHARVAVSDEDLRSALGRLSEKDQAEAARRGHGEVLRQAMEEVAKGSGRAAAFAKGFNEAAQLWREFDPFRGPRGPMFRPPFEGGPGRPGFGPGPPGRPGDGRRGDDRDRRDGGSGERDGRD